MMNGEKHFEIEVHSQLTILTTHFETYQTRSGIKIIERNE
jgi:hypothetical protein